MKKNLLIILIIFIPLIVFANPIGDVDGNGEVGINDYKLIRKHIIKNPELTGEMLKRADIDGKEGVTSGDYIILRKIILGINNPPIPTETITPTPTSIDTRKISIKFIISDTKASTASIDEVSCMAKINEGCNVTIPNLTVNSGYKFMGWSTEDNSKSTTYVANQTISINENKVLYAVIPKEITVTFNIGDNIDGKTVKAEKFSFNYTDVNGNTIIENEVANNIKETCLSYNDEGCKIDKLPVVYAKGYLVHGYSKTVGGKNIYVLNTKFKNDTTLYARVGYYNSAKVNHVNVSYQKMYGNVMFEIENGVPQQTINTIINLLDQIYKYYPQTFYYNGKIFILTTTSYLSVLKNANPNINKTIGYTLAATNYNNVFVKYSNNNNELLSALVHEIGHAFDNSFDTCISERNELINLYNKYKNSKNRPFRSYTYTNTDEFYADTFSATMSFLLQQKNNTVMYRLFNTVPSDVNNIIVSSLDEKRVNLKNINLIRQ